MPERKDLYDRISAHIWEASNKPVDWITEALLWRGFLVERSANEILLCTGSHKDDIKFLKEILPGPRFRVQEIPNDVYHLATISVLQEIVREDISKIASSGRQPGQGGTKAGGEDMDWKKFKKRKFGDCVDVKELDIGIALIVKTLALVGVFTNYSCDGFVHDKNYPWVGLNTLNTWVCPKREANYGWCKNVIDEVTLQLGIGNLGTFMNDPEYRWQYRWQIADPGFDHNIDNAFEVFLKIQRVARHLLCPSVHSALQIKKLAYTKNDLSPCPNAPLPDNPNLHPAPTKDEIRRLLTS